MSGHGAGGFNNLVLGRLELGGLSEVGRGEPGRKRRALIYACGRGMYRLTFLRACVYGLFKAPIMHGRLCLGDDLDMPLPHGERERP